jgi:CheY-like chemotaxis protein
VRGLRILVVDDNATNRRVLREILGSWGCRVVEAADAWEALDTLREAAGTSGQAQLALIDFQMPEVDGGQLAAEIKKDPRLAAIPLILVTSVPKHGEATQMLGMGFAAYLTKPVKPSDLHDAIAAVTADRAEPAPRLSLIAAPTSPGRPRPRVLVVDDHPVNQKVAVQFLERAGCACDVASSGSEAIPAVVGGAFDLVFMDCRMPGMDGYEATREIRRLETGRRTPIVAMTVEVLKGDRERCLAAGMDNYISKPVRSKDFVRMLRRYAPVSGAGPADGRAGESDLRLVSERETTAGGSPADAPDAAAGADRGQPSVRSDEFPGRRT